MRIEKLIDKLIKARSNCSTIQSKKNIDINIAICKMQIKIIEKYTNKK